MDIEFHYWVTAFLAKNAGFSEDETEIIAYSSQYVDDVNGRDKVSQKWSFKNEPL